MTYRVSCGDGEESSFCGWGGWLALGARVRGSGARDPLAKISEANWAAESTVLVCRRVICSCADIALNSKLA